MPGSEKDLDIPGSELDLCLISSAKGFSGLKSSALVLSLTSKILEGISDPTKSLGGA